MYYMDNINVIYIVIIKMIGRLNEIFLLYFDCLISYLFIYILLLRCLNFLFVYKCIFCMIWILIYVSII